MIDYDDLNESLVRYMINVIYNIMHPSNEPEKTAQSVMDRDTRIIHAYRSDPYFHELVNRTVVGIVDLVQYLESVAEYGKDYADNMKFTKTMNFLDAARRLIDHK